MTSGSWIHKRELRPSGQEALQTARTAPLTSPSQPRAGSARIQHGVRKRREVIGTNRIKPDTRTGRPARQRLTGVRCDHTSDPRWLAGEQPRPAANPALGSAPIQHRVRERRETTGINRVNRIRERTARLGVERPVLRREAPEKPQVSGPVSPLQKLPGYDHALDLVRPLVDLGDSRAAGSFRS